MQEEEQCGVLLGFVVDLMFNWVGDQKLGIFFYQLVIYEVYVKGLIMIYFDVFEELCGIYVGVVILVIFDYLCDFGIIVIEFLLVYQYVDDFFLFDKGLMNYWGYLMFNFFVFDVCYFVEVCKGNLLGVVFEFKNMVWVLYDVGIEVILDVVYNYIVEGNYMGLIMSFKGIDNFIYYCLVVDDQCFYFDYIGIGNSFNVWYLQML